VGFTQRKEPGVGGTPVFGTDKQLTDEIRFCGNQEALGTLDSVQDSSEEQVVATHPDAWLRTLKHAPNHSRRMVRIEAADRIESRVAANLRPLADLTIHHYAGRVIVDGSPKATMRILLPKSVAPHTAEVHDCNSHVLPASQPAIVVSLRVQLLLQIVNVGHQPGIGTAQIRWCLCRTRCAFACGRIQANGHVGENFRLPPEFFSSKVPVSYCDISLLGDAHQFG